MLAALFAKTVVLVLNQAEPLQALPAAGGAAAGAAIGGAVPVIGTAVGAAVGERLATGAFDTIRGWFD